MRCRAAPPRASPGRSAPSARRDGKAAAPLHAPRDRGGASGARVDSAGTGRGGVHGGGGLGPHCEPWLTRSEEHTSELQSQSNLVCRLLLEKKKTIKQRLRLYMSRTITR